MGKAVDRNLFNKISSTEYIRINQLAALMVYNIGLLFTFFEHSAVLTFLRALYPSYIPPKKTRLNDILLENTYNTVKEEVDKYLDT